MLHSLVDSAKKQCVINTLLFIGIVFAISFSLLKVTPFEVTSETYIGTIVTLLSLAATFVIGYQIYNAIEFKKEIENQKEKYNDIIKRNEEIEAKMVQQEFVMEEGFAIISALVAYNSRQDSSMSASAFLHMHRALISSIETDRTDYEWLFRYLRHFIVNMDGLTFSLEYAGTPNSFWSINESSEDYQCHVKRSIGEFTKVVKENDKKLRSSKNFCKIQMEYERVMRLLYNRLANIEQNPAESTSECNITKYF